LASEIITELQEFGFNIEVILADSLYGESSKFIETLDKFKLMWVLAIRSNHGVWLPRNQKVRANRWCKFERVFSNQKSETRYIREIVFGKRTARTYWQVTTDPVNLPDNSTSFVMTNWQEKPGQIKKKLGNIYGLRTWIEYGFRQDKQELGWTDYRLTKSQEIEKWWSIIMSAYLMVSLNTPAFLNLNNFNNPSNLSDHRPKINFSDHPHWSHQNGWKSTLNNLRLIIQPIIAFWLILPWLDKISSSYLWLGFNSLMTAMNQFQPFYSTT